METCRVTETWLGGQEGAMRLQRKLVGKEGFLEEGTLKLRTKTLIKLYRTIK